MSYNWRRKPGPSDDQPSLRAIQVKTPLADNKLIRRVVGKGNLSGFGLSSLLITLGVFYPDEQAWERTEQTWLEILESASQTQLEQIWEGLTSLYVMTEKMMAVQSGAMSPGERG